MKLTRILTLILAAPLLAAITACNREQPVEVFIPPVGDSLKGKAVFVDFGCYGCHNIPNVDLPEREVEPPVVHMLSGRMHKVKNYGDLMTAVIYPNHASSGKLQGVAKAAGENPADLQMPDFTSAMTVSQMIDLLAFLDEQYSKNLSQYKGIK